jgi:ABC-type nitrate/sulfonate/bicarbonate transport system substrate-binding protein
LWAVVGISLLLSGCKGPPSNGPQLTKFEFLIDWQAEPTYLGVYHAKELGLFRDLGLDVTIIQSMGANQAVSSVAAGRYKIATASGGATVLAYNQGAQMVSLGVIYPKVSSVVYGLARSNIRTPQDLLGKRIGIYPGSITKNEFDAFVKAQNLDQSKIQIVSLSGADIPLLLADQVDGVLHYSEMSPVAVELNQQVQPVGGKRTYEIMLADYGVTGYGLNVVTSRDTLNSDGDLVRKLAGAVFEGYRVGCAEPEKAVAAFVREFPEKDPAYVRESWSRVCRIVGPTPGQQTEQGWRDTIGVFNSLGLLTQPLEPQRVMP